jgi:predicted kinase
MLIVFAGLPGTGKTTISRSVAAKLAAIYLRIDAIEQAIRNAGVLAGDVGPSGYAVAQSIAEANLADGRTVVADCVNPVAATREGWRGVATRAGAQLVEVEVVCSDVAEHRRRVTSRAADIPGLKLPTWEAVQRRAYEEWDRPRLIVDTANLSAAEAVARVIDAAERAMG